MSYLIHTIILYFYSIPKNLIPIYLNFFPYFNPSNPTKKSFSTAKQEINHLKKEKNRGFLLNSEQR